MSSLVSTALRIMAVRLIQGRTLAGSNVHDSALMPIDDKISEGQGEPFVVVSSEDEVAIEIPGREITGGMRTVELVIEVAIGQKVSADVDQDGQQITVVIPETDAGLEFSMSLACRQVMRAIFEQSDNPWCEVFRRFAINVEKTTNRRGMGNKDGARFAARQIVLTIDCLNEPDFGDTLEDGTPFAEFLALMEADAELSAIAPLLRQTITGKPVIEDWDRVRSDAALSVRVLQNIGLATPLLPGEQPPETNEGIVVDDGGIS